MGVARLIQDRAAFSALVDRENRLGSPTVYSQGVGLLGFGICPNTGISNIYHCLPQQVRLEAGVLYQYALWAKRPRASKSGGCGPRYMYGDGLIAKLHWSGEPLCWLVGKVLI